MTRRSLQLLFRRGDLSTSEGRARERNRRVILSAFAAATAKGIGLLTMLITVPLTLDYLGAERYGIWTTITSFVALLSFTDLGLGYGLLNALSRADGLDDRVGARRAVSSAFFLLVAVGCSLGAVFAVAWPHISWGGLLNASNANVREAGVAVAVLVGCFLAGLPLTIVTHSYAALQQGFRASVYQAAGSVIGLAAMLVAIELQAGIPWLVLAASSGPLVGTALGGWRLFFRERPDLRPGMSTASGPAALALARLGGLFFVIQIAISVAFQSDGLVLARILGPEAVTIYSVTQKLFLQVPFILGYFLTPLWPAYSEAVARGDLAWVKRALRQSIWFGFAINVPAALALYFFAPSILAWWVGETVQPSTLLLACLMVWSSLNSLNGPLGMFFNGVGALRYQAITSVTMAAFNIVLSVMFTRQLGIAGVALGSIVAQTVFCYLPAIFFVPRLLGGLQRS
jgi:O-antigen/teichoic acid export membrane protein